MSLLLSSCVSVKIGGAKGTPATGVSFQAPTNPFKEIKSESADQAWLSARTGNTISFLSECGNPADAGLSQIENESLAALSELKIIKTEDATFNERAARRTIAQGQVDGVSVQISLLIFKKNGCNYTLTYGGVTKQFSAEENIFQQFQSQFKAP